MPNSPATVGCVIALKLINIVLYDRHYSFLTDWSIHNEWHYHFAGVPFLRWRAGLWSESQCCGHKDCRMRPRTIFMSGLVTIFGMLPLQFVLTGVRNCIVPLQALLLALCWRVWFFYPVLPSDLLHIGQGKSAMLNNSHWLMTCYIPVNDNSVWLKNEQLLQAVIVYIYC